MIALAASVILPPDPKQAVAEVLARLIADRIARGKVRK